MKNLKKLLAFLLAVVVVATMFAGCEPTTTTSDSKKTDQSTTKGSDSASPGNSTETKDNTPDAEPIAADDRLAKDAFEYSPEKYYEESDKLYDEILGEYYEKYQASLTAENLSERYALQALAEGKLLGAAVFIPLTSNGGTYRMGRTAARTANTTLWGNDNARVHNIVVATEMIPGEVWEETKEKWMELKGTGTYESWVRDYLTGKGYTLKDTYTVGYSSDPKTWDVLNTYRNADSNAIIHTYDGLMEYDMENEQKPALATEYKVSEDGKVYTFKIREGVVWVDSQGREVGKLTADDFVAGMQHLLDAQGGLESLAADDGAHILNAQQYLDGEVTDFAQVGVKAVDEYTLEYTLSEPVPFFMSMLSYGIFAPMNRAYYASQGGKFGADYNAEDENYKYGIDPTHIAYCGPYIVSNATEKNTIVFKQNPSYWNKDKITIKTITWMFNDGSDLLKAYNDCKSGTIDACSLNTNAVESARKDKLFDQYVVVSDTGASTFNGWLNVNRKAFSNFNDASVGQSTQTMYDATRTDIAMKNLNFRRALCASLDHAARNAQTIGEDLKYTSLRNSYVPGDFVQLLEDVTVSINGTDKTFAAGTNYGEIVQAQLDADGVKVKAWDPTANNGHGSSDGYDGWYNPEYAKSEFEIAVKALKKQGVIIDKEHPIVLDLPFPSARPEITNQANAMKQSMEAALDHCVEIRLVDCNDTAGWYYAGYYPDYGYQFNCNMCDVSGWGPDYGDPQTYLATITPSPGGMVKSCGIY